MARQPTPDERRFQALASSSFEHVTEIDGQGRLVYVSPDDRPGFDTESLGFHNVVPEDRTRLAQAMQRAFETGSTECVPFRVDNPVIGRRWVEATITPFEAEGGERHALIVSRDVTDLEQARTEQERLTLQLQEARRLESLGVLAGGIAHDFNNLLAVVLTNVRYARTPEATCEDRDDALADAAEAAENAARLVRQLLDYAGRRDPEVRRVDVSELAASMTELLATALPNSVELDLEPHDAPLHVHADVVQLERVLMNLVLNAADAVGDGPGRVSVRTHPLQIRDEASGTWLGGAPSPGRYVCIEVEDTGCGMDEATRARIFEPFFSTKHEGHGLGLSAVLGLVQGHRGAIEVTSERGRGTRFRIALPADPPRRAAGTQPLVLVIERDGIGTAAASLREAGFHVLVAGDAREAEDLWRLHGEEIEAAVIDTRGSQTISNVLVEILHAGSSDLPILWMATPEDADVAPPGVTLLRTPCSADDLCGEVAASLEKPGAAL